MNNLNWDRPSEKSHRRSIGGKAFRERPKGFACPACLESFKTNDAYRLHWKEKHNSREGRYKARYATFNSYTGRWLVRRGR